MNLEQWVALAAGCLLLALTVLVARRSQARGDGVLTALSLFGLVWGLALVLFAVPLVEYTTTPAKVWLMVYGSIATFVGGALLAERRYRNLPHADQSERQRPDPRRLRIAWILFAILGLIGFVAYVHAVDVTIGWQAIFNDPQEARIIQTTSPLFQDTYGPWKLLTYCNQIAFILWTLGLREKAFSGRWRPVMFLGILSLAPFIFTGDRTLMIAALIWAGAFQLLYLPPLKPARLLGGFAVAAVLLTVLFSVLGERVGKTVDGQPQIVETLTTRSFDPLVLPFVYATGNIPAFGGLVDDPIRPDTYGQLAFSSATKLLHGFGLWGQPAEMVGAFYAIPFQTFNNYSWLGIFYSDFGVVGVLLLPFIFAFLTTAVVLRAIRRRTLLSVWVASLLLYCVSFTFDGYKFFDTLVSEYLLAGLVIVPLIRADLGPALIIERVRNWAAEKPRAAIASSIALAVLACVALVGFMTRSSEGLPTDSQALVQKLNGAADLSRFTLEDDEYPTSEALASRLHVNDPAISFVGLPAASVIPGPGTIGVYTTGDTLFLKVVSEEEGMVTLRDENGQRNISVAPGGVAPIGLDLVTNGGFNRGLKAWSLFRGEVGRGSVSRAANEQGAFFRFTGSGQGGSGLVLVQDIPVQAPADSCFAFSASVRSADLSRSVLVWAGLQVEDGSSPTQLVLGGGEGIAPGTGNGQWKRLSATGVNEEEVASIRVFAVDTGEEPISGRFEVDDLSLERQEC